MLTIAEIHVRYDFECYAFTSTNTFSLRTSQCGERVAGYAEALWTYSRENRK